MRLALAAAWLLISGCSRVMVVVRVAPWYAERQVTSVLSDLDPQQRQRLKTEIKAYWDWNKRTMIPAYGAALRQASDALVNTVNAAKAKEIRLVFTDLYNQSTEPAIKPSVALLLTLNPDQINNLEHHLKTRQAEQRRLYLTDPAKAQKNRAKRLIAFVADWAGPLTPTQQEALTGLSRPSPISYQAWLDEKVRREAELVRALREKRGAEAVEASLRELWLQPRAANKDRKAWQWDENGFDEKVGAVVGTLNTDQKQRAKMKFVALAAELDTLASKP